MGKHGVFPKADHDEVARFNFLTHMNVHLSSHVIPGVRETYENRVEPNFKAEQGRSFDSRHEVRRAMSRDSFYQWWSALRRSTMEMRQQAGRSVVLRQIDALNNKASEINEQADTLTLNSAIKIPSYVSAVDTHCMPGSYHTAITDKDVSAGANYDCGLFITTAGSLGAYSDAGGQAVAEWVKREPKCKPKRILDIGCTIGHNVVPLAQAFPDAEVIAVDCSEPVLRYAHARAQSLGVNNLQFIQANGEDLSQFEDASFDLVTTCMFLHELSIKSLPKILGEISRLLKPGALSLHLEQPQYAGKPVFEQFMRDWDTYNNNEPFWGPMHDLNLVELLENSGIPEANQFEVGMKAKFDESIFPASASPSVVSEEEDFGRAPIWHVVGAWKPAA